MAFFGRRPDLEVKEDHELIPEPPRTSRRNEPREAKSDGAIESRLKKLRDKIYSRPKTKPISKDSLAFQKIVPRELPLEGNSYSKEEFEAKLKRLRSRLEELEEYTEPESVLDVEYPNPEYEYGTSKPTCKFTYGRYWGEVNIDGLCHGKGLLQYKHGDMYKGGYKNGKRNGKGTYFFRNGNIYVGYYKDDVKCGRGVYLWKNGNRYDGEFRNDMMHGLGRYYWRIYSKRGITESNWYEGEWRNDKKGGLGFFYWSHGPRYEGEWLHDRKNGHGRFFHGDGNYYIGNWRKDQKEGHGTYYFASGNKYVGQWANNEMHGRGKKYDSRGKCFQEGRWERGAFVVY